MRSYSIIINKKMLAILYFMGLCSGGLDACFHFFLYIYIFFVVLKSKISVQSPFNQAK